MTAENKEQIDSFARWRFENQPTNSPLNYYVFPDPIRVQEKDGKTSFKGYCYSCKNWFSNLIEDFAILFENPKCRVFIGYCCPECMTKIMRKRKLTNILLKLFVLDLMVCSNEEGGDITG